MKKFLFIIPAAAVILFFAPRVHAADVFASCPTPSAESTNGSDPAANLFDNVLTTRWASAVGGRPPSWAECDLASPVAVNEIKLGIDNFSGTNSGVNDFTLTGSNDGFITSTTLLETSNLNGNTSPPSAVMDYPFTNSVAYSDYRINVVTGGAGSGQVYFYQWEGYDTNVGGGGGGGGGFSNGGFASSTQLKDPQLTAISFLEQGWLIGGLVGLFLAIMLRPFKKVFRSG